MHEQLLDRYHTNVLKENIQLLIRLHCVLKGFQSVVFQLQPQWSSFVLSAQFVKLSSRNLPTIRIVNVFFMS